MQEARSGSCVRPETRPPCRMMASTSAKLLDSDAFQVWSFCETASGAGFQHVRLGICEFRVAGFGI